MMKKIVMLRKYCIFGVISTKNMGNTYMHTHTCTHHTHLVLTFPDNVSMIVTKDKRAWKVLHISKFKLPPENRTFLIK